MESQYNVVATAGIAAAIAIDFYSEVTRQIYMQACISGALYSEF